MLKFEQNKEEFTLSFKNHLFLKHDKQNPCFKIGKATARIRGRNGEFKIKERDLIEIPLTKFNISSKNNDEIVIEFSSAEEKLIVSFSSLNERLEMEFNCPNAEFNRFWIKIAANQDEAIYGCGEQYSELNLRGKIVPLWVEEQGIGRGDPPITGDWYTTYYPQPTFISSENYFCHCESSSYARFNFTQNQFHELYIWSIPEKILLSKHDSALETVSKLSEYLGRQPELPDWVYDGLWLGIQGGKEVVDKKIEKCLKHGVKVGAVWCQDWQGIRMQGPAKRLYWNWEYSEEIYPDLPSYIKELNQKGIKFLGYNNSFLTIGGTQHKEAVEKKYLLKNKDGSVYHIRTDSGDTTLLDLTNPNTQEWLKQIIKENMLDIGLSGWMADYCEYLPTDAILHSGEDPEHFHNKYPAVWARLHYEALEEAGKLGEVVFFTRAGYTTTSKYTTMMWAGDQLVGWSMHDGLASVIPAGISLGICGIGYFHSDIGGFHSLDKIFRDKELFMRWAEFSVFTMTMRTHESIRPFDNWQFDSDEETLDFFGKMSRIYVHLKPYLKHLSNEYQKKGYPPIRACYLHYENEPVLHEVKYQYLLGQDLLVAPIYKPNINNWKLFLPDDEWIHLWSGKEFQKGWHDIDAPIGEIPVFYRKISQFSDLFDKIKNIK